MNIKKRFVFVGTIRDLHPSLTLHLRLSDSIDWLSLNLGPADMFQVRISSDSNSYLPPDGSINALILYHVVSA